MAGDYLAWRSRLSVTVFVIVLFFIRKVKQQTLPERIVNVSACYSDPNAIRANCSSTEMIAVDKVNAGAKLITTSCMSAASIVNLTNPDCCECDNDNDCYTPFVNQFANLTYIYHEQCIGQETCGPIPVQWMLIPDSCKNSAHYRNYTGYLDIYHYCIKNTSVGVLPDVRLTSASNSALYLQGQQYPAYMPHSMSVNCSIEVTGGCGVSIQAIHISFDKNGGVCQQNIMISDLSGRTEQITCDNNNNYNITKMYSTASNYVILNISSQQGNAQFWIGFIPNSGGTMSLSCPAVAGSMGIPCAVTDKPPSETTTDDSTETSSGSTSIIIAVVVSIILLLLIILIVVLLLRWKYRKQKEAKVAPEKDDNVSHNGSTDSNHDIDVFRSIPFETSTAPWATAVVGSRGSNLPPIKSQTNDVPEQDSHKKKKKKKKRKKKKKNNDDEGQVLAFEDVGESNE